MRVLDLIWPSGAAREIEVEFGPSKNEGRGTASWEDSPGSIQFHEPFF